MHQPLDGQDFGGGQEFPGPWGALRSSNLTPHANGLGDRTEQQFVGMFKAFDMPVADLPVVPRPEHGDALADPGQADRGRPRGHLRLPAGP